MGRASAWTPWRIARTPWRMRRSTWSSWNVDRVKREAWRCRERSRSGCVRSAAGRGTCAVERLAVQIRDSFRKPSWIIVRTVWTAGEVARAPAAGAAAGAADPGPREAAGARAARGGPAARRPKFQVKTEVADEVRGPERPPPARRVPCAPGPPRDGAQAWSSEARRVRPRGETSRPGTTPRARPPVERNTRASKPF